MDEMIMSLSVIVYIQKQKGVGDGKKMEEGMKCHYILNIVSTKHIETVVKTN